MLATFILGLLSLVSIKDQVTPDLFHSSSEYEFTYSFDLPQDFVAGSGEKRVWIPYPREDLDQKVLAYDSDPRIHAEVLAEKRFGNKVISFQIPPHTKGLKNLSFHFRILRNPSVGIKNSQLPLVPFSKPLLFLGSDQLVRPFEPQIRELAKTESKGITTELSKVRAFYDHVYQTMTYDKSGQGWGRGDSVWACRNRRGNCTDFHSLLIAMTRSQNIPARFIMGVPIPETSEDGRIPGYHCWAEVYLKDRGWIPLDISEAKNRQMPDSYFGHLPSNRIALSLGRDIKLNPPQDGRALNYFLNPYAEWNGREVQNLKAEFSFQRVHLRD